MPKIIAPADSSPPTRRVVALMHAGFLLVGIANTLLGPILPLLSNRWHLSDAQAGHLFTAQFAGAIAGSALSGWLMRKLGVMIVLAAGYGGLAAATAALACSPWPAGIAAIVTLGFSLGLTNPATNLLISELNPERRAAALNLLNLVWGLGAIICPLLIALFIRSGEALAMLFGLALLLAIVMMALARVPSHFFFKHMEQSTSQTSALRAWLSPYALLTGALVFIYVGTETAISGWIGAFMQRLGAAAQSFWALAPALFWTGLLAGRAVAPAALRRVSEERLVLIAIFVAIGGILMILSGQGIVLVCTGAFLAGLGLAPVFPTTFALFTRHFGSQAAQLAGVIFVLASLGGAVLPWLVGFISSRTGDLRVGLLAPLLGGVVMLALQLTIIALTTRVNQRASSRSHSKERQRD